MIAIAFYFQCQNFDAKQIPEFSKTFDKSLLWVVFQNLSKLLKLGEGIIILIILGFINLIKFEQNITL